MVDPCPVLYLDWETDAATHAERLSAIQRGDGAPNTAPVIRYKRMAGSLVENVEAVKAEVDTHNIGLVIVDSLLAAAVGPLEESNTVRGFVQSLRYLNTGILIITHTTKSDTSSDSPFGSIYWRNMARNTWLVEAARIEGDPVTRIRMQHTKSNNGTLREQHGYEIHFQNERDGDTEALKAICIRTCDLSAVPEFTERLSLWTRVSAALAGGALTRQEIIDELLLDESEAKQLAVRLSEWQKLRRVINLPGHKWGLLSRG